MRRACRISRLRPLTRRRPFGLINERWPAPRRGRQDGQRGRDVSHVPRHFHTAANTEAVDPAPIPVNLAVTNLTLCPRLELRLAQYHRAVTDLAEHTNVTTQEFHAPQPLPIFTGPGQPNTPVAGTVSLRETLLQKVSRIFLKTPAQRPGTQLDVVDTDHNVQRPEILMRHARQGQMRSDQRPVSDRVHVLDAPVPAMRQRAAGSPGSQTLRQAHLRHRTSLEETSVYHLDRVLSTQVLRRIFARTRIRTDKTHVDSEIETLHMVTRNVQRKQATAAQPGMVPATLSTSPSQEHVPAPSLVHPPAQRVFRAPPEPSAPPPVQQVPVPAPQAAPEIDIASLDKEIWRRFEKRLRIEYERRGRG